MRGFTVATCEHVPWTFGKTGEGPQLRAIGALTKSRTMYEEKVVVVEEDVYSGGGGGGGGR